jgi:hypothetical protein
MEALNPAEAPSPVQVERIDLFIVSKQTRPNLLELDRSRMLMTKTWHATRAPRCPSDNINQTHYMKETTTETNWISNPRRPHTALAQR